MKKYLIVLFLFIPVALMAQGDGEGGFNVWTVISAVLAILSAVLGTFLTKFRKKAGQFISLGKELFESGQAGIDLVETVLIAGADNNYNADERKDIKAKALKTKDEWGDVKVAWKALWSKEK